MRPRPLRHISWLAPSTMLVTTSSHCGAAESARRPCASPPVPVADADLTAAVDTVARHRDLDDLAGRP